MDIDHPREIQAIEYEKLKEHCSHSFLPANKAQEVYDKYGLVIHDGFMMRSPVDSTCLAYGKKNYGTPHYYYLGRTVQPSSVNGEYYCFDSMDSDADGLTPAGRFSGDIDAIQYAREKEATLYKEVWKDNNRTDCRLLYEPWACFSESAV